MSNFRRFDVDAYDEDRYQEDEETENFDCGPTEKEVQILLNDRKNVQALQLCLSKPPFNFSQETKAKCLKVIVNVLCQFKGSTDVTAALKELSSEEVDLLMKYIYKGMASPTESSCRMLLLWHEKTLAKGGKGCIIRAITDRKGV